MGRAHGKHTPRQPTYDPDTPEGREIGRTGRQEGPKSDIPGGINHLKNEPTVRQKVPIPAPGIEYSGIMAHGVPPYPITTADRADAERGGPNHVKEPQPKYLKLPQTPAAVPVQIMQEKKIRTMAGATYTVPAQGTAAIRIAGRDYDRVTIQLLVETLAGAAGAAPTGVRIDHEIANLDANKGALIRAGGTSYLTLACNDELFAVSNDGSACTLSVIYLYGISETD